MMAASTLNGARITLLLLGLVVPWSASFAAPLDYALPPETAAFLPGPNLNTVLGNCTACHSSDYISTQPRGAKFGREFWQAEVTKMIKVYGAPIDDADVGKIVEYLAATYSN